MTGTMIGEMPWERAVVAWPCAIVNEVAGTPSATDGLGDLVHPVFSRKSRKCRGLLASSRVDLEVDAVLNSRGQALGPHNVLSSACICYEQAGRAFTNVLSAQKRRYHVVRCTPSHYRL
jgi:hypothetical protein